MNPHADAILEISGLRFAWPGGPVLLDLPSLTLRRRERLFLHGPSGSGKSTLLGLIAGIHVPDSGSIRLLGQELGALGAGERDRLRGEAVGFVFQQFNLVPYLNLLDNVCLPLVFSRARRDRSTSAGRGPLAGARQLLEQLGLPATVHGRLPGALSVGQQQRVAVARALLGRPPLIVCDEPTSALDADARDVFMTLLIDQCEATGAALVFVSHDASLARYFPHSIRLTAGEVLAADEVPGR